MERKMWFGVFHPIVSLLFFVNHPFPVPSNPSPIAHGSRLRDMDDENVLDYLDVCVDFIDKGSVLVHCFAGLSRRSTRIPEEKLVWVKQLLSTYTKWAKKLGYKARVIEKCSSTYGGVKSATIEFEFAYGYLSGETGVHNIISSQNGSALHLFDLPEL